MEPSPASRPASCSSGNTEMFNAFKKMLNRPRPILMFGGLKLGIYKNEKIPKDQCVIAVHPDNFEKVQLEVLDLHKHYEAIERGIRGKEPR